MVSTHVYLPEEMKDALRRLAEEQDTSQSALIREALNDLLATADMNEEERRLDETFGIWKDRENIHEEFREIRESMDRDVWRRVQEHHDDVREDNG